MRVLKCLLAGLFVGTTFFLSAQVRHTISGVVEDAGSNEVLFGVTISDSRFQYGVSTNEYGFYSMTIPEGEYELIVSFIGYQKIKKTISLTGDKRIDFALQESVSELDEVVITGSGDQISLQSPQMSIAEMSVQTIKSIPTALGEPDVIKSLMLMPGVTNGGETSSGFNVRGGATDQNLVLMDEATIFNPSHLFGFFSVFNSDAVRSVRLYKGAIPARYGGRLSSVLEIYQRTGNSKEVVTEGGIGTATTRVIVEGPLKKDTSSFLLGGRGSHAHFFLPLFGQSNYAYFYDFNGKVNFRLDNRNTISMSGYHGKDTYSIDESFLNTYGNSFLNFRLNHIQSEKVFTKLTLVYSNYASSLALDLEGLKWRTAITSFTLKHDWTNYTHERIEINYGFSSIYMRFNPGEVSPSNEASGVQARDLTQKNALESAFHIGFEHKVSPKLIMEYGVRASVFLRLGQDSSYVYKNNDPIVFNPFTLTYTEAEPTGISVPAGNGIMAGFGKLEPRFSTTYRLNAWNSVKGSYTRAAQYIHLISNTNSPTPVDVWEPSGPFIRPQMVDQVALGYIHATAYKFTFETEVFGKKYRNRLDYIDGANLIANNAIERVVLNGEGRAYGWEVLLKKSTGSMTGWIAYTLSKTEQRTPGRVPKVDNGRSNKETGINLGQWYHAPYDKRHDITVFASRELSKQWSSSANFTFQTGQPTNYPIGQFEFQGVKIPYYGPRNSVRLPNYHRLDLSLSYLTRKSLTSKRISQFVFGVYNVYNRRNTASINFRQNQDTGVNEAVRTSVFGIVPTVTYNFKF